MIINESSRLNESINLKELEKEIQSNVDKRLYLDPKSTQNKIWVNYSKVMSKSGKILFSGRMSDQLHRIFKNIGFKWDGLYADDYSEVYKK